MKLAQFKVQFGDKHYFDNVIYHFQKWAKDPKPQEVHSELLFSDGSMFSSTGRGWSGIYPGVGTRFIHYNDIETKKWRTYDMTISDKDEATIKDLCTDLVARHYDWLGILGMALPFAFHSQGAFYCSEVCNHVLAVTGIAKVNKKLRPSQIVDSFTEQGIIKI